MKKLLCFVLALVLMLLVCTFSSFAAQGDRCFSDEFYLERFEKTMNRLGSGYTYNWHETFTEQMVYKSEEKIEYTMIAPNGFEGAPMEGYMHIGEYVITFSQYAPYYKAGIYVYVATNDEIYTLTEAYEMMIPGITEAFNFLAQKGRCAVAGDANLDRKLNVKDATTIQKQLAGLLPKFPSDAEDMLKGVNSFLYYALKDFNLDEVINIKDATAIQKYLAGIEE